MRSTSKKLFGGRWNSTVATWSSTATVTSSLIVGSGLTHGGFRPAAPPQPWRADATTGLRQGSPALGEPLPTTSQPPDVHAVPYVTWAEPPARSNLQQGSERTDDEDAEARRHDCAGRRAHRRHSGRGLRRRRHRRHV